MNNFFTLSPSPLEAKDWYKNLAQDSFELEIGLLISIIQAVSFYYIFELSKVIKNLTYSDKNVTPSKMVFYKEKKYLWYHLK